MVSNFISSILQAIVHFPIPTASSLVGVLVDSNNNIIDAVGNGIDDVVIITDNTELYDIIIDICKH